MKIKHSEYFKYIGKHKITQTNFIERKKSDRFLLKIMKSEEIGSMG